MIRARWLVLAIAILLIVIACQPVQVETFSCDLSIPTSSSPQSPTLTIAIYVDGTPSMQGYVKHPTNAKTRYAQTIELLDQTFFVGKQSRAKSLVEYYRLGETSKKTPREGYLQARLPKFYNGSDPNFPDLKVSKIETAITPADDNKLTVIITDLYQDGEDVTKLNKKIEDNYFNTQKGFAVGILGIKSEFNGDVYIEDGTNRKFTYNTNDTKGNPIKSKEFRPFYVIFIGQYRDIDFYFKNLSDSKKLPEDSHLVIFSPSHLVNEVAYLQGSPNIPPGLNRVASLNNGQVAVETKDKKNEFFEIDRTATQDLPIEYSIPLQPLSNTLLVEASSINVEIIQIKAYDPLAKMWKVQPQGSPFAKALELNQWQIDEKKNLKFVTTIKPNDIPDPGVYLFTVDAVAKGVQEQEWWSQWSSSDNTNNDWKTYNLEAFLKGLKGSTDNSIAKNKVAIGRFCYAIQKN